jgi:leucyl-tRNA synthetase
MEYDFQEIEKKWQQRWRDNKAYKVTEDASKQKYYVLDMFPYPSGAGLHVGHPLGYIASDIMARYKRHQGFNVLHPMGYDSFGLPAEQYAIQTGQHPAITTEQNIARYREQLDKIGFAYDWDREVRTSDPEYYRWTQWIFGLIFESWYNKDTDKAEPIGTLIQKFEENGTYGVNAHIDEDWYNELDRSKFPFFGQHFAGEFTATDWKSMNEEQQQLILMHFRLAYIADSVVNWCPALGTVLANDEIKDGKSERGGHPVVQKKMRQWSMRITAYAQRLLDGLESIDWTDNIKDIQRNWIGRSEGASVNFQVDGYDAQIEVFTTRPDTIFGVSFMTLAPEHELVKQITTDEYREAVEQYIANAQLKTERDRQADVKNVTGQFTGAYVLHPFTGEKIPVWIGEYVLAGYGTGAVMAVPAGDQRDWDFAKKFNLPIPNIFEGVDISEKAEPSKDAKLANSDFLNGMKYKEATSKVIEELEARGIGKGKINYRMRDAVFSRQRYWGEPFPIYYKGDIPYLLDKEDGQVTLPQVDKYLPTEDGEPPLARAKKEDWSVYKGDRMEYNTMPGWAGSSWYFLRYMDAHNSNEFASRDKVDYWNQVDLYMGGAEHATGHLLYSRFWTKILFDLEYIGFDEPFKKMINQGMILGRSSYITEINRDYLLNYSVGFISAGYSNADALHQQLNNLIHPSIFLSNDIIEKIEKNEFSDEDLNRLQQKLQEIIIKYNPGIDEAIIAKTFADYFDKSKKAFLREAPYRKKPIAIQLVDNDVLQKEEFKRSMFGNADSEFITFDGEKFICSWEIEKMSKSKYNVQTPDELVEKFGADTLRLYEMFLGPVEQHKPWDTKGINGVHNFLRKYWRLSHDKDNNFFVNDNAPTPAELKALHTAIKKVTEDLNRYSWNTVVSTMMICVNELTEQKCNNREVLKQLTILLSPYAPHMAEELWEKLTEGKEGSVMKASWPAFNESYLIEANFEYPISFNGKTRYFLSLPVEMSQADVEAAVRANENTAKYLDGKDIKKMIVVPKRIVNVVI